MLNSFLYLQTYSKQDNGHFSVLVQGESGLLSVKIVHKVTEKKWLRWWTHSEKADTQSFEPQIHCPEVSSKAKAVENCRSTIVSNKKRLQLLSHNYFCKSDGAIAEMCEEYESCYEERPDVGEQSGSSFVPNVIKTEVPFNNDGPSQKDLLLQRYGERIEKLSQQDKLIKFFTDAGFLATVEVGQCSMTKDTE